MLYFLNVGAFLTFSQLFLDGFDLFVKVEVALIFFHLAFDTPTDFFIYVQDIHFPVKLVKQILQPQLHIRQIQDSLFVFQLERQMRSNRVDQSPRIINAGNGSENFRGNLLVQFDVLVKLLHDSATQSLNLAGLVICLFWLYRNRRGHKMRLHIFN